MLGLAEGVFDRTMKYINQRTAFGSKIADFQGVQFQVATAASGKEDFLSAVRTRELTPISSLHDLRHPRC